MIVDYFLVRRGNLDIEAMYDESSFGKYYFVYGVNWRAVAAFVAGFALPLPGFIGSFGTASVSSSATYMYDLGWELSFVVGGLVYWILCLVFPVPGQEDCRKPFGEMIDEDWTLPNGLTKSGGHVNSNIEAIEDKDGSRDIVMPA
jgi:NCS1 family nucleobase:cation symporter-1